MQRPTCDVLSRFWINGFPSGAAEPINCPHYSLSFRTRSSVSWAHGDRMRTAFPRLGVALSSGSWTRGEAGCADPVLRPSSPFLWSSPGPGWRPRTHEHYRRRGLCPGGAREQSRPRGYPLLLHCHMSQKRTPSPLEPPVHSVPCTLPE